MTDSRSLLRELEDAFSRGSPESRLRALWHATDLLITGRYTDDQIWVFGEVIGRLAEEIETTARSQLAIRLSRSDNAPVSVIHKLAFDDSIDVAGPVLRHSERLDVRALVANAQSKSQQHLLAISKRQSISEPVTDVLVTRGNQEVASSVATNQGARFSDFGFLTLIKRSDGDSILAENLGLRRDIPRHLFQQLIAKASDDARRKLERERPEARIEVDTVVADVTGALHAKFGPTSKSYFAAKRRVGIQHRYGELGEDQIFAYAQSHKFDEVLVALSLLCALSVDVVERALVDKNKEVILVLAKAVDLSWTTTMAVLFLGAPDHRITAGELGGMKDDFAQLNVATCKQVLRVYQSRKEARTPSSDFRRLPQLHTN
jgi:uncharacterized protein (DUF2336 family)